MESTNSRLKRKKTMKWVVAATVAMLLVATTPEPSVFATNESHVSTVSNIKYDDALEMAKISSTTPINKVSGISREDFIYVLSKCKYDRNRVLADNAGYIWDKCAEYGVNEFAVSGLIAFETGWCTSRLSTYRKNLFSIRGKNGGYVEYSSYEDSIAAGIKLIAEKYLSKDGCYYHGNTLQSMSITYTGGDSKTASKWTENICDCSKMLVTGHSD